MVRSLLAGSVLAALLAFSSGAAEVAITFDDLPGVPGTQTLATQQRITRDLLRSIKAAGVPAVGFVNEEKLASKAHVALLQQWLDAGLELGNHTYGHPDLHQVSVDDYERDIVRGEKITRELLRARKRPLRWFRHPFLHTGTSLETKRRIERFLAARGYRIAPVTLDNSEWIFARAYVLAPDANARKRVGQAYLAYMDAKLVYFEDQSRKLFGRNIRHVLLLHANELNADWFDELAASMKKRGYAFVTLEHALEDPAYRSADTYTGRAGLTWLHRWAMTAGRSGSFFAGEPATPKWIQELARIEE